MKYTLNNTWVNDSTITALPTGATLLTDSEWENRNSTPYAPTLAEAKAAQITKINQSAEIVLSSIKAGYPESEILTWTVQFDEATALALSATAKTPTIDGIVLTSGLTKTAVQTKVLDKATSAHKISGEAIGKRQKLSAQINLVTTDTNEKVAAIVW